MMSQRRYTAKTSRLLDSAPSRPIWLQDGKRGGSAARRLTIPTEKYDEELPLNAAFGCARWYEEARKEVESLVIYRPGKLPFLARGS